ncbi:ATP-binding cassette domain-containing protein [Stappia sp. WLB 29]|uniref:ATP-binding cassette domain-containing protein n=1 Tax=Stappia sp. WLB 29 TaxID=2925220 RepID=UPI0020BFFCAE|nr:ATP-binding cassette domain-containing protein [Stappia sp. WLB 29]
MREAAARTEVEDAASIAAAAVPALLEAQGLRLEIGGKRLIDGIDIRIGQGRKTMIMGANGAGKSLLLRLLHGLIVPTAGRMTWRGGPLDKSARRAQAMVFQRPVMLRRSVLANLAFALKVRGLRGPAREARIAEALDKAQLGDLARSPARVLSGGEQQRLALARALACDPELLFLDEPTASLDPASTQAIESLIADASRRGVTVVMVSHDLGQARRLADDIVFLQAGRVAESGPASRVLCSPRSEAAGAWLEGRLFLDGQGAQG